PPSPGGSSESADASGSASFSGASATARAPATANADAIGDRSFPPREVSSALWYARTVVKREPAATSRRSKSRMDLGSPYYKTRIDDQADSLRGRRAPDRLLRVGFHLLVEGGARVHRIDGQLGHLRASERLDVLEQLRL